MASYADAFNLGNWGLPPDSNWTIDRGQFETAWEGTAMSIATATAQYNAMRYTGGAMASANYEVTAVAQSYGDFAYIGPGARLASGGNGYAVVVKGGYGADLVRLASWAGTVLGTVADTQDVNVYYTIKLQVNGSTIKVFVDGVEKLSVTDATYSTGQPGIVAYGGDAGYGSRVDSWAAADLAAAAGALLIPGPRLPMALLAR